MVRSADDVFEGVRNVSGGEVAGLVVAVFWAILVAFLAVVLVRLAGALKEATRLVAGVTEQVVPLLGEAAGAVRAAGARLERADPTAPAAPAAAPAVTPAVTAVVKAESAAASAGASALSSAVSSALDGPLVKVAAFGHGLRYAVHQQGGSARAALRTPGRTRSSARTARTARATRVIRAVRAARAARARTALAAPRAEPGRGGARSSRRSKG